MMLVKKRRALNGVAIKAMVLGLRYAIFSLIYRGEKVAQIPHVETNAWQYKLKLIKSAEPKMALT